MCCHPEFLQNKKYRNEYTQFYVEVWDDIYSNIWYLGFLDKCTEAWNIIKEVVGFKSFELLERAAKERNARTSEWLRELAAKAIIHGSNVSLLKKTVSNWENWLQKAIIHGSNVSSLKKTEIEPVALLGLRMSMHQLWKWLKINGPTQKLHRNWAMA